MPMRSSRIATGLLVLLPVLALGAATGCGRKDGDGADAPVAAPRMPLAAPKTSPPSGVAEGVDGPDGASPEAGAAAPTRPDEPVAVGDVQPGSLGPTTGDSDRRAPGATPGEGPSQRAEPKAAAGDGLVVVGTVELVSHVPKPGEAPYTECLTYLKYRVGAVESGEYGAKEILVVFWGMKGNKLEPAASFKKGQQHRLHLSPFADHPELSRVMAADDTEEYELTAYWADEWAAAR